MNVKEAKKMYQKGYAERTKQEYENALAQIRGACQNGVSLIFIPYANLCPAAFMLLEEDGYVINGPFPKTDIYEISGWQE